MSKTSFSLTQGNDAGTFGKTYVTQSASAIFIETTEIDGGVEVHTNGILIKARLEIKILR